MLKKEAKNLNLLDYFICDERDLSPAYVASCRKFLKEVSHKLQAASAIKQTQSKGINKT